MLRRSGHLVLQIELDNPGIWGFHCHIGWHASMGMTMHVAEDLEGVRREYGGEIKRIMQETCTAWDEWTKKNRVDQVDAGI